MKNGTRSASARKPSAPSLACLRSAISNGTKLMESLDQRSAWARRLRDLINDHVSDLGGDENVSHAERLLVRRVAMLALQLELMEQKFAHAEGGEASPKMLDMYQRTTGALRRTLESLGLQRRQKDITPSLGNYLKSKTSKTINGKDDYEDNE